MLVAPAALTATGNDELFTVGHIVHNAAGLGVTDERTAGDTDVQTLAVLAGAALALTVHAIACDIFALVSKVHQRGHIIINNKDNIAASAAVAAIGAACCDILLTVERDCAVAAVARLNGDPCLINKRSHSVPP